MLVSMRRVSTSCPKAANAMKLVAELPSGEERRRYKKAAHHAALYTAAARLWAKGLNMAEAVSIVETAMKSAGEI